MTILASLLSGLLGVFAAIWYQTKAVKTAEKMRIFKRLMADRFIPGASYEKTRALNSIGVVFYEDKKVLAAWKGLYSCYGRKDIGSDECNDKMIKLLEAMAICLGYNLDLTTIKESYLPLGISEYWEKEEEYRSLQLELMRKSASAMVVPMQSSRPPDGDASSGESP